MLSYKNNLILLQNSEANPSNQVSKGIFWLLKLSYVKTKMGRDIEMC